MLMHAYHMHMYMYACCMYKNNMYVYYTDVRVVQSAVQTLTFSLSPPFTHTHTHLHHSSTASSMRTTTDPADFLDNPIRYVDSFNLTNSTLAQFTPCNSVIFLGTHKITFTTEVAEQLNYTSDDSPPGNTGISGGVQFPFPELDVIEPLYRTPFHREQIPDELLTYWNVAKDDQIHLPAKNQFIPADFTILTKTKNDSDTPKKLSSMDNKPASMWWLLDTDDFHEPRVNIICHLNNTNASISAAWEGVSDSHLRNVL